MIRGCDVIHESRSLEISLILFMTWRLFNWKYLRLNLKQITTKIITNEHVMPHRRRKKVKISSHFLLLLNHHRDVVSWYKGKDLTWKFLHANLWSFKSIMTAFVFAFDSDTHHTRFVTKIHFLESLTIFSSSSSFKLAFFPSDLSDVYAQTDWISIVHSTD